MAMEAEEASAVLAAEVPAAAAQAAIFEDTHVDKEFRQQKGGTIRE